ncbi:hypothetical protein [Longimycelium tulufanense]|uniref:hypothetical protein n=1 Tax=Longimycelium tulufanense TaxID=907463 RepID=UPI00166ED762|nr:hypothetical protein [Longimycelium tulufanense]
MNEELEFWLVVVPGSQTRTQVHAFPAPDQDPLVALCGLEVNRALVEKTNEGMPCVACFMKVADGLAAAGAFSDRPPAPNPLLAGFDDDLQ